MAILKKYILSSLLLLLILSSCEEKKNVVQPLLFLCSAETVDSDGHFTNEEGLKFINGKTQSSDYACTGKHSSKLDSKNPYGLGYDLQSVKPGDEIKIEVRRKVGSKSELVFHIQEGDYKAVNKRKELAGDWEYIRISTTIKGQFDSSMAKIYCKYVEGDSLAYFDDLKIRIYPRDAKYKYKELSGALNLQLNDSAWNEIQSSRVEAFKVGYILPHHKNWFKGTFNYKDVEYKGKARLKGDMMDHLNSDKWSFRIKSKKPIIGMKNFSIQKPESRKEVLEWFYHKIMEKEGILTTKYDFIPVEYNGLPKGVFAIEEHFKKGYLTSRNLEISSILTWNDHKMWDLRANAPKWKTYYWENKIPMMVAFPIKNHIKSKYDSTAIQLFDDFRHGQISVSEAFDLEKIAKLYAIANVMKAEHNLVFHNLKFYYNPSTEKLEPIAYDGFGCYEMSFIRPFIGFTEGDLYDPLHYLFLTDSAFMESYVRQMKGYANMNYFRSVYTELESEIKEKESLIQSERAHYKMDTSYLNRSVKYIQESLVDFDPYQYAKFKTDTCIYYHTYITEQHRGDSLMLDVHIVDKGYYFLNYYHQEVNYIYDDSTYILPAYLYNGYPVKVMK